MRPALIRRLVEHFAEGLPSDVNLRDYLVRMQRFNPESVATFIKVFRDTVEFAQLYEERDERPDLMEIMQTDVCQESSHTIPPQQPTTQRLQAARTERLIDDYGAEIILLFQKEPSSETYEYLRDYLDFKLKRIKKRGQATE